jgi:phage tail sheath protein FI
MAVQNFGSGGGFQVSPGVNVSEIDLTTIAPSVDTSVGAFAGVFRWGPVGVRTLVTSENDLVNKFGKPHSINPETWFTASNFLSYSNALYISRAANTSLVLSAVASGTSVVANSVYTIQNEDDYTTKEAGLASSGVQYVAKYPGELGNTLKISVCETANQFTSDVNFRTVAAGNTKFNDANTKISISVGTSSAVTTLWANAQVEFPSTLTPIVEATAVSNLFNVGDFLEVGTSDTGKQALKITSKSVLVVNTAGVNTGVAQITFTLDQPLKLSTDIDSVSVTRYWEYYTQFDSAPGRSDFVTVNGNTALQLADTTSQQDEVHIVVVDEDGGITGSPGSVLEVFNGLSRATDAKLSDNTSNYYKNIINNTSNFVWFGSDHIGAASNTALNVSTATNTTPFTISMVGGTDTNETDTAFATIAKAYDLFTVPEEVDLSFVLTGKSRGGVHGEQLANYLIDNIAEVRKDCMVFISPASTDVINQPLTNADNVVEFRNAVRSTSFAVMDSGYKYQYDKYNDVFRWIPLNADIAGTCVRTDSTRDPWFSPAGTSRGQIKNAIKLAYNPTKGQRDLLYKNGVNPVINESGVGTILFGDKTLLSKPSAFDRINVRRLFIVLEKSISQAAKSLLFEFNDEFTRTQFRNIVEPFLRDIQGRQGIYDFKVVCDETNNTPQVIDANRFVGDIYVKPARAINYIQLNFVAVRTGIEFAEIVG